MKKSGGGDIRSYFAGFAKAEPTKKRTRDNEPDPAPPPSKKKDRKNEPTKEVKVEKKKNSSHSNRNPKHPKRASIVADLSSDDEEEKIRSDKRKKRKEDESSQSSTPKKSLDTLKSDKAVASPSKTKLDKASPSKTKPDKAVPSPSKTKAVASPSTSKDDSTDKVEKKRQSYQKFMSRGGPKHLGSKEFPEAEPNCLEGKAFVITGVLDSFERDDVADVIKNYGGRVVSGVSKKTNYLIVGDEAGESKLGKAKSFGIPQLTEDDFLNLLGQFPPTKVKKGSKRVKHDSDSDDEVKCTPPSKKVASSSSSSKSKPSSSKGKATAKTATPTQSTTKVSSSSKKTVAASAPVVTPTSSLLWVDKYKPTSLKNVVGQTGDNCNAKKLLRWLQNWYKYHGSSTEKVKAAPPGQRDPEGKTFKVALLSGPPGIGKTTSAVLCCKELGYTYQEMNASDKRNKSALKGGLSDALDNMTLNFSTPTNVTNNNVKRNHVIIMDEVDGMSGNQDRGGIAEVIHLLKTSRIPIICICNDRNSKKIRSLANYCFDLRFKQPTNEQLKGFIQSICFKEKIKLSKDIQQQLITSTDHDVRQILHQMQMVKDVESSDTRSYNPKKDLQFGPWEVARMVFSYKERAEMKINDKALLFFHDYQLGPLFVQENYLRSTPKAAGGDSFKTMDLVRAAAESLALGDMVENVVRRTNAWSLLPVQGIFQSVLPGEYMQGDAISRIDFPAWFGRNSNQGKRSRLLQQLHTHMHLQISGSLQALNMEYLPYLRRAIVKPLASNSIDDAVSYMTNYSLIREDLDTINEVALWPNMRDLLANLDSKSKAAFTRQVNKESFVPYSVVKAVSKRGKGGAGQDDDELGLEEEEEGNGEELEGSEEEDEISRDAMIKVKKSRGKASETKNAGNSESKSSSSKAKQSTSKSKPSSSKSSNRGGRK